MDNNRSFLGNINRIALMLIALLSLASCELSSGTFGIDDTALVGTWASDKVYYRSDSSYDYACEYTIEIAPDGNAKVISSYFMKERTESEWVPNLSMGTRTKRYIAMDRFTLELEWDGEIEFRQDNDYSLDLAGTALYRFQKDSESGETVLVLSNSRKGPDEAGTVFGKIG